MHAYLKNEFTEDKKCQTLMSWLILFFLPRNDDKVRRHLHQAAQKLAMLKRLQTAQEQFSKDSAVYTFSEDDLSADDQDPRRYLNFDIQESPSVDS